MRSMLWGIFGLILFASVSNAQVVVKVMPVAPVVKVAPPPKPHPTYVWVDGHWVWSKKMKQYVWKEGYWIRPKKGHCWVPGHWANVPGGVKWVPGHWSR